MPPQQRASDPSGSEGAADAPHSSLRISAHCLVRLFAFRGSLRISGCPRGSGLAGRGSLRISGPRIPPEQWASAPSGSEGAADPGGMTPLDRRGVDETLPATNRRRGGPICSTALQRFHVMSRNPQPLDRMTSGRRLWAAKRLPLDRRVVVVTLRAVKRRRGGQMSRDLQPLDRKTSGGMLRAAKRRRGGQMSRDPQPLDRMTSGGMLRAVKRLPLDRKTSGRMLRAARRRRGGPSTETWCSCVDILAQAIFVAQAVADAPHVSHPWHSCSGGLSTLMRLWAAPWPCRRPQLALRFLGRRSFSSA